MGDSSTKTTCHGGGCSGGSMVDLYQHRAPVYQNNGICTGPVLYNCGSKTTETFYDIPPLAKLYKYSF